MAIYFGSTTKEAFKELVSDREKCEQLGIKNDTRRAYLSYLNSGRKISLDKMEELLEKAGFKVVQEKLWNK